MGKRTQGATKDDVNEAAPRNLVIKSGIWHKQYLEGKTRFRQTNTQNFSKKRPWLLNLVRKKNQRDPRTLRIPNMMHQALHQQVGTKTNGNNKIGMKNAKIVTNGNQNHGAKKNTVRGNGTSGETYQLCNISEATLQNIITRSDSRLQVTAGNDPPPPYQKILQRAISAQLTCCFC